MTRSNSLFSQQRKRRHKGVRAVVTGQVGMDKKDFLQQVVDIAKAQGREVLLFNVGDLMYAEAPDIVPGRILDLSRQRLTTLRRSVFKDILRVAATGVDLIVNTHATFRWKHGLFPAYDFAQMRELDADLYVTLVDNVDAVHERLVREHDLRHSLKDILVWREEEIVVTEAMADAIAGYGHTDVVSRSNPRINALALYRLMFEPHRKKVYPSFPMTHVMDAPAILAEIEHFRDALAEHFITFDPADVDEKQLMGLAGEALRRGQATFVREINGRRIEMNAAEISSIARDIDGQIYARDFKLIDQSDMVVSYIPAMPDGRPALSSGVERELHHAFEGTREAFVVWRPETDPSPFVTETATRVFRDLPELFTHFQQRGYISDYQLPLRS
jgi:adenylate kinase